MTDRYETKLQGAQEVETSEYLNFLQSMDDETLDTYFAIEQERISVQVY